MIVDCKALFLDFYGTLALANPSYAELLESTIAQHSARRVPVKIQEMDTLVSWYALCDQANGDAFKNEWELVHDYLAVLWEHYDVDYCRTAFAKELFAHESVAKPYAETALFLKTVQQWGIPVYVVSNADNAFLHKAIAHNGWQFDRIISSEDCRVYKPHPAIFETALAAVNCEPSEVLYIGDSWHCDVQGAGKAGLQTAWINRHDHELDLRAAVQPTFHVSRLTELLSDS